jgi:hypothetical protein
MEDESREEKCRCERSAPKYVESFGRRVKRVE